MRQHPQSKTEIQQQTIDLWRVVEQETNRTGFTRRKVIIEQNLKSYDAARNTFNTVRTGFIAAAVALTSTIASAAPPEGANPAYKEYYEGLRTKEGYGCCSVADCRIVRMEMRDGSPWVFIDKKSFGPSAPYGTYGEGDWIRVPAEACGTHSEMKDGKLPTRPAEPTACWYEKKIRCYDWPLTQG